MSHVSRRDVMKTSVATAGLLSAGSATASAQSAATNKFVSSWHQMNDRVWLGEHFWANPMEDWRIVDGAAEVQSGGGDRNIHLLTHQFVRPNASFETSVQVKQVATGKSNGGAGFRVGIQSDINEYRSNCFSSTGIRAGVVGNKIVLGNKSKAIESDAEPKNFSVKLLGQPIDQQYELTVVAKSDDGKELGRLSLTVDKARVLGNIAVVSNLTLNQKQRNGARYRFTNWQLSGDAFKVTEGNKFGAILWSMYSLSDSRSSEGFVMKISALTPPLGERDNDSVELQVRRGEHWKSLGHQRLDKDAWTATFRIANWDEKQDHEFRLVYQEKRKSGPAVVTNWDGVIRSNPSGRPLRMGALTCQNHYGFPYEPVANNVKALDPDLLYFSGDQLYESHGGYGLIREPAAPAILNYLRKYYMFGMAFREAMRDRPTLCIPDDHDVFQGNIWGEGGAPMKELDQGASSKGGYREPARMVNVVHKTNAAHHPDFYDPTPCLQDISVYYGDMVYGDVSFAILGDRQWKSGPERVETGSGRADHVKDADVATDHLDKPGLVLLGERQEEFLKHWVSDWRGHKMKVLLSQTVFAGVATHHGGYNGYLKADLDSGGWPQTARNNAIRILREGMPLHINGDQHLTSLVQYGVEEQRDSNWSFCVPAISAGYPRWWRPDEVDMPHKNRPAHGLPNTGEFLDGFGNKAYVYAVGNPEVGREKNRYALAHQKGSGFGFVTIDTEAKTYKLDSYRFLIDPLNGNDEDIQFPGWPVIIHQSENAGQNKLS